MKNILFIFLITFSTIIYSQEISKKKTYKSYSQDLEAAAGIIDIEDRLSFYFAKDYVLKAATNCTNNDSFSEAAEANYGNKEISESRIKTLAEIFLSSWKTKLGLKKFNEMGKSLNWIGFSECYVRKTQEISNKDKNKDELISRYQDIKMSAWLNIGKINRKLLHQNYLCSNSN